MYVREVKYIEDIHATLNSSSDILSIRDDLLVGDMFIVRRFLPKEQLIKMRNYMIDIGRCSLPNYQTITKGVPNFHRIDRWDPRAHVKSCFHSFSFFPWNLDVFDLFRLFKPVYQLKNLLRDLPADSFLGLDPDRGCTARLAFHCYPAGIGGLNRHQDPFDYHQITVPVLILSEKGKDYKIGGNYVETGENEKLYVDDICKFGDIVYFNAKAFHGVDVIDPETPVDWLSFQGRWIILFAVNKLADNDAIGDSVDLGY